MPVLSQRTPISRDRGGTAWELRCSSFGESAGMGDLGGGHAGGARPTSGFRSALSHEALAPQDARRGRLRAPRVGCWRCAAGKAEPSTSAATRPPQTEETTEPSHRRSVVASKRPQKSARRENRRRDAARRDAPWWREVRAAEWGARAYGGGPSDYARGYVREGFFGDMR